MKKDWPAVMGTVWFSKMGEEQGEVFVVDIHRLANTLGGITLSPARWERWHVKAVNKAEAELAIKHHFHGVDQVTWIDVKAAA